MEDLRAQIEYQSSQAARLSQEAAQAAASRNFMQAGDLMKQAVAAGRACSALIEQYAQSRSNS